MAKKKTRVLLPGGIQGLVKGLQNGTSEFAPQPLVDEDIVLNDDEDVDGARTDEPERVEPSASAQDSQQAGSQRATDTEASAEELPNGVSATNREDAGTAPAAPAPSGQEPGEEPQPTAARQGRGRPAKENTIREYHIVKDDSRDSWELFVDMARQYKQGGGKLATIYIDETLKSVLDRMKYAGPEKFSTSAILSSIVARFIYDHEDEIKKTLFSGNLL